jgi:ATP-binding cassette subfamily C (CFTR/MRP) protein 1
MYIAAVGIWTRTLLSIGIPRDVYLQVLGLRWTAVGVGAIAYALECMGPSIEPPQEDKVAEENPLLSANIYSIWVSWLSVSSLSR